MRTTITKIIAIGFFIFFVSGCTNPLSKKNQSPSDTLSVTASFYPLAFLAEQIGGDFVTVTPIVSMGVEPHEYEPTPSDFSNIVSSKVFIYHGAGMDAWASRISDELTDKKVITVNASSRINLLQGSDPHFWLDTTLMQKISEQILTALSEADPAHRSEYEHNANQLVSELQQLHDAYTKELTTCRVRSVATSHNAFAYLANRYGFEQVPITGISPEVEPSIQDIKNLITLLKYKNIKYVTFETLASARIAEVIATEVGAQSLVLNPIEGLTQEDLDAGDTYISLMNKNLQTLKTVMECN